MLIGILGIGFNSYTLASFTITFYPQKGIEVKKKKKEKLIMAFAFNKTLL